jgi:hypothetical protein
MKKTWLFAAFTIMALSLGTVTTQYAQSSYRLEGTIPFNFMLGNRSIAYGDYSFQSTNGLLKVMGKDGRQTAYVFSNPGSLTSQLDANGAKLVFNKYGGQYFLSKVVNPQDSVERQIPESKAEREAVKNQTVNSAANNKTVQIAMEVR